MSTGELFTWGLGEYGRLGHGDNQTQLRPKQVRCAANRNGLTVLLYTEPFDLLPQTLTKYNCRDCSLFEGSLLEACFEDVLKFRGFL